MKSILHALISIGFLALIVSGNTINRSERSVDINNQNNQQIYESASFRDAGFDEKLPERLLPSQAQRNTSRKLLSWSMFFKCKCNRMKKNTKENSSDRVNSP